MWYRTVFLFAMASFQSCNEQFPEIQCRYNYIMPRSEKDSTNYFLPVNDYVFDSVALYNSNALLLAFHEPNISLSGSDQPIVRLVLEDMKKYGRSVIRIQDGVLYKKKHLSGDWTPQVDPEKLTRDEKADYYVMQYKLGLYNRVMPDRLRYQFDSIFAVRSKWLTGNYFDSLVRKATLDVDFRYSEDSLSLSGNEISKLFHLLSKTDIFKQPIFEQNDNSEYFDDGGYYIEVNTKKKYSVVQRSFNDSGRKELDKVYNYILQLSGLAKLN